MLAGLPVSSRATVMTNDVLLSITEPSAESSIPTCPILHFWTIVCRWLWNNVSHDDFWSMLALKCRMWKFVTTNLKLEISQTCLHTDSKRDRWAQGQYSVHCVLSYLICMIWFHTVRKWMNALLTLPDCKHQEKHKENQGQSLHAWVPISFQTLLLTGWCCIYTAFQQRGWSPSCSVRITITKYRWMMGVWGLRVRTISLLS